ncbi:MAG: zinc ribbon domain-containing protein [Anaerolineae bacterium]|nr:zinc ribbon domain-containing protein [Anaerolineae bacterium]
MPDGSIQEGHKDESPAEGATFRGYIEVVERMYRLCAKGNCGRRKIAEVLHSEGYWFRDRHGNPCRFSEADVRVIIDNWPEYGGVVLGGKARDRDISQIRPDTILLNPERAIIDTELCYLVGKVRMERQRWRKQSKPGPVPIKSYVYPLSGFVYCAHCYKMGDRTPLSGYEAYRRLPRYRHADKRHPCDARNKSVKAEIVEAEFARLVSALAVKPDAAPELARMFSEATQAVSNKEKRAEVMAEITLCRQRIENAEKLFLMARLDEDTLKRHIDNNERQIARLQAEMNEESHIRQVIELAVNTLADAEANWDRASNEDR